MPNGAEPGPVENVGGTVGVSRPPAPMVKADTLSLPLFATYKNCPFGETAIPCGEVAPTVENVAGTVGVSTPVDVFSVKAETVAFPLLMLATYRNCPFGDTVIP